MGKLGYYLLIVTLYCISGLGKLFQLDLMTLIQHSCISGIIEVFVGNSSFNENQPDHGLQQIQGAW